MINHTDSACVMIKRVALSISVSPSEYVLLKKVVRLIGVPLGEIPVSIRREYMRYVTYSNVQLRGFLNPVSQSGNGKGSGIKKLQLVPARQRTRNFLGLI